MGDVIINGATRKKKRMHTPRLKIWKLREPSVTQEFARVVTKSKNEVFETENVESKWNTVKCMTEGSRTSTWVDKRTINPSNSLSPLYFYLLEVHMHRCRSPAVQ